MENIAESATFDAAGSKKCNRGDAEARRSNAEKFTTEITESTEGSANTNLSPCSP
jgi:hypothetical protein